MLRCDSKMAEVSWRVGGTEVVGGYRVLSMAMLFALLKGSRRISLIRVCNRQISPGSTHVKAAKILTHRRRPRYTCV